MASRDNSELLNTLEKLRAESKEPPKLKKICPMCGNNIEKSMCSLDENFKEMEVCSLECSIKNLEFQKKVLMMRIKSLNTIGDLLTKLNEVVDE